VTQNDSGGSKLTREEIEELRERVRSELVAKEQQRSEQLKERDTNVLKERIIKRIEREEEERYYTERGYRRFVDKTGNVKWFSPEQYRKWETERTRHQQKRKSLSYYLSGRKTRKTVILVLAGIVIVVIMYFLAEIRRG